jgi:ribose transport system ATP-binding protein
MNQPDPTGKAAPVPALRFAHLSKSFGGARALEDVSLTIGRQEVHGLLGQNGSGKSTLIKILAGFHAPDAGSLEINGEVIPLPLAPGQFKSLGIAFVHQHLGLIPSLSVIENLRIGTYSSGLGWIDWAGERRAAQALFRRFGLSINPDATVQTLPAVERAMLAIVRAFEDLKQTRKGSGGVLVLDEPTPFLPKSDVDRLFALVRSIVAEGASVVLVSHDIDEVLEITDSATVLRNGEVAGTVVTVDTSRDDLVELIVGKKVTPYRMEPIVLPDTALAISIKGLTGSSVTDVSIDLKAGEIVGLTGLIGSGYGEVPYLLFGDLQASSGTLAIGHHNTQLIAAMRPDAAQALGVALLPGDRLAQAGVGALSITDNITLSFLDQFLGPTGLDRSAMRSTAHALGVKHGVRPNNPDLNLEALSGGNQQKVLLAKWVHRAPKLLLLDEPTQGVDFGARQQIFSVLDDARRSGTAILCASTDYEQLEQICDRVIVFNRGRIVSILSGTDLTKYQIASHCYQNASLALAKDVA